MIRDIDTHEHYAPSMRERDQWIVYATNDKKPRAPWKSGTLHNARWNSDLDEDDRPQTSFDDAQKWSERSELHFALPGGSDVEGLHVGYILAHDINEYEQPIMLVDLDDVRNPETNEILDEAWELVERLDSYTEVSQSGKGLHVFVHARLPEYVGKLVEPFDSDEIIVDDETPKIELYDHGRVAITTGRHVVGTPEDVHESQDVIDDVIDQYYDSDDTVDDVFRNRQADDYDYDNDGERSVYFNVDAATVVNMGQDWVSRGSKCRGPHPVHGSTNNDNCAINGQEWYCFRHDTGGIALHLVAVQEGFLDCGEAGKGSLEKLTDREFAELCMRARDEYGFPHDEKPPYRAVLGVAKEVNLVDDRDDRVGDVYDIALDIYEKNSWSEL